MTRLIPLLGVLALLAGCDAAHVPADGGHDASRYDAGPVGPTRDVDVLFVADDPQGGASIDDTIFVAQAAQRLFVALATGDRDLDGTPDTPPVRSVHVGVTTGDLGTFGVSDAIIRCSDRGDDGALLQTAVAGSLCSATYPTGVLRYDGGAIDESVVDGIRCLAFNNGGCFFQQGLEAALKALSPAPDVDGRSTVAWTRDDYVPPTFAGGSFGHAGPGGANDGFVRPDSVLVILLVRPIDDCSVPDASVFSESQYTDVNLHMRCHMTPDPRFPIERYVDGFIGLRRAPSRLVVAAFAGVPIGSESRSYADILADPSMQETIETVPGTHVAPICFSHLLGESLPGRRMVRVLEGLQDAGAHTFLHSLCDVQDETTSASWPTHWPEADIRLFDTVQAALAGRP